MVYQDLKFRAVNGTFYCPELVPGSKNTFTTSAGDVCGEIMGEDETRCQMVKNVLLN